MPRMNGPQAARKTKGYVSGSAHHFVHHVRRRASVGRYVGGGYQRGNIQDRLAFVAATHRETAGSNVAANAFASCFTGFARASTHVHLPPRGSSEKPLQERLASRRWSGTRAARFI